MPSRDAYPHGIPSWIDLSTTDPAAAKEFYSGLFGWSYEDNPTDQGGIYTMARIGDRDAAGLSQQPEEQAKMGIPPLWNSYVSVDDLDAVAAKVEGAGGGVMAPPFDVMDFGRMAVITDPTGAVLCLWEAKAHVGAGIVNEHGAFTWNELVSPDVPAAAAFYGELFGWGTESMDMGDAGPYTLFMVDGEQVAGAMAPPMDGIPPNWGVYFHVDDTDACVAAAEAAGASVLMPAVDGPPGRFAAMADPQGAMFSVITPAEA